MIFKKPYFKKNGPEIRDLKINWDKHPVSDFLLRSFACLCQLDM